jgi:ribulose-phosphate 3-epimerase
MEYLPSLACANQIDLASDLRELRELGFTSLHYDVMDGHYVPNLCLSLDTARQLKSQFPDFSLDVHLMTSNPENYIEAFARIGAEYLTFHPDAVENSGDTLRRIRERGLKAGLALNPEMPLSAVEPYLDSADLVLVMSIAPGYPGTPFKAESYGKIEGLAEIRKAKKADFKISVDGGINPGVSRRLALYGADMQVLGYLLLFNQSGGISGAWNSFVNDAILDERRQ